MQLQRAQLVPHLFVWDFCHSSKSLPGQAQQQSLNQVCLLR